MNNDFFKTSWVRVRCPIKVGLHQSGISWYLVITASSYKVAVLVMLLINLINIIIIIIMPGVGLMVRGGGLWILGS